jgi:ABC-type branched-subunit amino acid transport system substrate-binding protein
LKAVGDKTDVIWSYDWTIVGAIQIFNILKDLGYKGIIWQTCGTLSPDVIQGAKAASEGAWSHAVWDPVFTNPESVAFVEALKKAYGPDVLVAGVSDVTEMGYVGVKALCFAMDKAGTATDVKKIDEALFKLDFVMPTGAKFALDETGWLTRVDEHYIQVVNGQMVLKDVVSASKINEWLAGK